MSWCFALINNRLAEIFFEKCGRKIKILAHCYVKREEYKTKKELCWIDRETKKFRLSYRNKHYRLRT